MEQERALDFAGRLTVLKYAPVTASGIFELSKILAETCTDDEQAEWLVTEMRRRFDEWPGPATMQSIHAARYPQNASQPETWSHTWKSERACNQCSDIGLYRDHFGVYRKCDCEAREFVSDEMIADYNRRLSPRKGLERVGDIVRRRKDPIQ
jgi:hypothetical protein